MDEARNARYGMPVVRALPLVYPDDPTVADMFNQYMYGDALLVAPILTAGATSRSVYLPAGNWIDYNDKVTHFTGPTTDHRRGAAGRDSALRQGRGDHPARRHHQIQQQLDTELGAESAYRVFPGAGRDQRVRLLTTAPESCR